MLQRRSLSGSASEPCLRPKSPLAVVGLCERFLPPELSLSPKTPRTLRGTVRKASKVSMSYPSLPSPLASPSQRTSSAASTRPSTSASTSPGWRAPKRVSFADEHEKSAAFKRSMAVLSSLYSLRRAGWEQGEEGPEEPEEPLMRETLRDLADTEAALGRTEGMLLSAHEPVHDCGGSRHATAVVSSRTLLVVQRKRALLRACEERLAAFQRAQARAGELLAGLVAGTDTAPQELLGVNRFVAAHTHRGGQPVDENKSDFQGFASSFLLPTGHQALRRLDQLAAEATAWWAKAALKEAQAGTDTAAVLCLINLATAIQGDPNHEAIVRCRAALGDVLAENALRSALALQLKDAELVARSAKAQPESAKKCAELINAEITAAVKMGAPPPHASLSQAKKLATDFVQAEKDRLAQRMLEFAQLQWRKDEASSAKCQGVPPVGPASDAADAIDREMRATLKHGVPELHPVLQEARKVAKALRDEDGRRKRMAARERRLAAQG